MMLTKLLVALAVVGMAAASSAVVKMWQSSAHGPKRHAVEALPTFYGGAVQQQGTNSFEISTQVQQRFEGVGGSFMRAGATVLNKMPKEVQEEILMDLFDPKDGARFVVGKVPIACTDFGVPKWYTYAEEEQSEDLPLFNMDIDLDEEQGFIPLVKRANEVAGQPIRLEATLDYLPKWMLNTTTPLPEPQMNTTLLPAIANYYFKYAKGMKDAGVPVEYLSLFNEMDDSYMFATLENTKTLLVDHIGPMFRKEDWAPKLTWTAYPGRQQLAEKGGAFLDMKGTAEYVDILFYHGYDCNDGPAEGLGWQCLDERNRRNTTCPFIDQSGEKLRSFLDEYQGSKQVWMTELCYASEFADYYPPTSGCPDIPRYDFDDAMQWGKMMFVDFNKVRASAWLYWNLILDTTGGPWVISPEHNDPLKNPQQPLIVADPTTGKYWRTGAYYSLWHFGRATPGSDVVQTVDNTGLYPTISKTVFYNKVTAEHTVVIMNDDQNEHVVTITIGGEHVDVTLPPISLTTMVIESESEAS